MGCLTHNKEQFQITGNKSYYRTDAYVADGTAEKKIFHLSFDDTILIFEDLESKPESIFDVPTIKWFKELHDKYGVVISCYVYYEDGEFNLTRVPDKYRDEFVSNSDWLRFGFHTKNSETDYEKGTIVEDYNKTVIELNRIVGSQSIDNFIRLQMFKGSYDEIKKLTSLETEPVVGLFTADDNRMSYYLDVEDNSYIYSHDSCYDKALNLWLISTDLRTEYVESVKKKLLEFDSAAWNNQKDYLVVFTHEWALSVENKEKVEKFCEYASKNGYRFAFFEDVVPAREN